jgi:NADPH:quinone reductase
MKIAILGSGKVAHVLGAGWKKAGHEVFLSARNPGATDPDFDIVSLQEALERGDIVVNAITGAVALEVIGSLDTTPARGKTLLDVANALTENGELLYPNSSLAEHLQAALPEVHVVKSLNTAAIEVQAAPSLTGPATIFVSGDDHDAKAEVVGLLHDLGWTDDGTIDLGGVQTARGPESYAILFFAIIGVLKTPFFNIHISRLRAPGRYLTWQGDDSMALKWEAVRFGGPEALELVEDDVPAPGTGEVVIDVRAVGMNPADYKHIAPGQDPKLLPLSLGYEISGVISAIGRGTEIASGGGKAGDEVIAAVISGGYATRVRVKAADVFAKPASLPFPEAAGLILAGSTASELLHVTDVGAGDMVLVHGASGSVGISVVQQALLLGARVVGTAGNSGRDVVRRFGGQPIAYGTGLEERVRAIVPGGVTVAIDTVGTDEAVDVSLALVADRDRIATTVALGRADKEGFHQVGARNPASGPYRAGVRSQLIELAADGSLKVPVGRVFPLAQAPAALEVLMGRHPAGKIALIVDP